MSSSVAVATASMSTREVLGIRTVRRMWYATVVSTFGDFLALYAVLSVVSFRMNATAEQITWVQIVSLLPLVLLGPLAGVFVDRWPLKSTMVLSDSARAVLTLLLLGATHLWHLYLILAAISIFSGFFGPAQQCAIRTSVPPEGILSTNAIMQQAVFGVRVIAPAIAGMMVASFGAASCYVADSISFIASALLLSSTLIARRTLTAEETPEDTATGLRKVWTDLRSGFVFIVSRRAILFVVVALAAAVFTLGCFAPLIAIYVRECLHGSTRLFGITSSMLGVGILGGFFAVQGLAKRYANRTLVFGGLIGMGAGLVVLAALPLTAVALLATLGIGIAVAAIMLPAQTLVQQETPEELIGRVASTGMSLIFGAQILGLLISGALTKFTGVREMFFGSAVALLALVGVGVFVLQASPVNAGNEVAAEL